MCFPIHDKVHLIRGKFVFLFFKRRKYSTRQMILKSVELIIDAFGFMSALSLLRSQGSMDVSYKW